MGSFSRARSEISSRRTVRAPHSSHPRERASSLSTTPRSAQNFVAYDEFNILACKGGTNARRLYKHVYDVLDCAWKRPDDYSASVFD